MRRLARVLVRLPEVVAGVMMLAITAILFAAVVWRYFFLDPLPWSDEVAKMLFVWLTFIGAALGVERGLHASVAVLTHRLSARGQRAMALFGLLVVAVVAVVLVVVGGIEAAASFRQEVMPVTRISKGWTHVAVPIAGGLMLVYLAAKARVLLRVAG